MIQCIDIAYSSMWDGSHTITNGKIIEELKDDRGLVCMNDGAGTRINIMTGNESALDITLVSNPLAALGNCYYSWQ